MACYFGWYTFWLLAVSLVQEDDGSWRQPINELGEPCPWPFDPPLLLDAPLGQYHCPYCGGMQMAGEPHFDWSGVEQEVPF